jgi:hypothetical protein
LRRCDDAGDRDGTPAAGWRRSRHCHPAIAADMHVDRRFVDGNANINARVLTGTNLKE